MEKTYKNLGEELAYIYKNSVCNEEYIRDYLDMVIPDMLREAARSGYQKKDMKSEDIMRYRHGFQNYIINNEFFTPWSEIVERWGSDNGLKVWFTARPRCDGEYDVTFAW